MKMTLISSTAAAVSALALCFSPLALAQTSSSSTGSGTATGSSSGTLSPSNNVSPGSSSTSTRMDPSAGAGIPSSSSAGIPSASSSSNINSANPSMQAASIQQVLQNDALLGTSASRVNVSNEGQRVVLRGSVASQSVKDQVEQLARQQAAGASIDNQIVVTADTTNGSTSSSSPDPSGSSGNQK